MYNENLADTNFSINNQNELDFKIGTVIYDGDLILDTHLVDTFGIDHARENPIGKTSDFLKPFVMNSSPKDELNTLCEDMSEYVKYLRNNTYHPYDKEAEFVQRLRKIIEKI